MLHAIIYFALAANFWAYNKFFQSRSGLTASVRMVSIFPAWTIPWCVSVCLFVQAVLTLLPLLWLGLFFNNFLMFHTIFILAELLPIVLIVGLLQESAPTSIIVAAIAA